MLGMCGLEKEVGRLNKTTLNKCLKLPFVGGVHWQNEVSDAGGESWEGT